MIHAFIIFSLFDLLAENSGSIILYKVKDGPLLVYAKDPNAAIVLEQLDLGTLLKKGAATLEPLVRKIAQPMGQ